MSIRELLIDLKAKNISVEYVMETLRNLDKEKRNLNDYKHPLSQGQRAIWFAHEVNANTSVYNIPICLEFINNPDVDILSQACKLITKKHPILASQIGYKEGKLELEYHNNLELDVVLDDQRHLPRTQLENYIKEKVREPFNLVIDPLIRFRIISAIDGKTILLVVVNHIVFDGRSVGVFLESLASLYNDLTKDEAPKIIVDEDHYRQFVLWENEVLSENISNSEMRYWQEKLSTPLAMLDIPTHKERDVEAGGQSVCRKSSIIIPSDLFKKIKFFIKKNEVSDAIVFLSIFKILLHKVSRSDDVIICMPIMQRPKSCLEKAIGYYVNILAIRNTIDPAIPFVEFSRKIKSSVLDALDNSKTPFPEIIRKLNLIDSDENLSVFQVGYSYQNFFSESDSGKISNQYGAKFSVSPVAGICQDSVYELELDVKESDLNYELNFKYMSKVFAQSAVDSLAQSFLVLTNEIFSRDNLLISQCSIVSQADLKLINEWNNTEKYFPAETCIHTLFEQQVRKTPTAVALVFDDVSITYTELNHMADVLAKKIHHLGIGSDKLVGIFFERSIEMVVSIIAILKAGGAYVPLDPSYPDTRLMYLMNDTDAALVLTSLALEERLIAIKNKVAAIVTIDYESLLLQENTVAFQAAVSSKNLAYVIYTSGSTGNPKGVMIEHSALCNRIHWMQQEYKLNESDRVLQKTPFSFDVSGWEFHWPLAYGATLVIALPEMHRDPHYLIDIIEKERISILHFVPSMLQAFLEQLTVGQCTTIKKVMCSGEKLLHTQVNLFHKKFEHAKIYNLYGPTEAAIDVTACECVKNEENITIGKPIDNIKIHIVDRQLNPVPIGVSGELCIAGVGLARGYWNNVELTAEKFLENPFIKDEKIYRTGDLAKWNNRGQIEYLGRIDRQLKLHGFRIELSEIEAVLIKHSAIKACAVVLKEKPLNQLVAYCTLYKVDSQKGISSPFDTIREYLRSILPAYMVPTHFVEIENIPLTSSGKVDTKSLMLLDIPVHKASAAKIIKTSTGVSNIENKVNEIWQEILHVDSVSVDDTFFNVGGDSILAIEVAANISRVFNIDFRVTTFFKYSSIRSVSKYLSELMENSQPESVQNNFTNIADHNFNSYENFQNKIPQPVENIPPGIAIIGISACFAGCSDHVEFWRNLLAQRDCLSDMDNRETNRHSMDREGFITANTIVSEKTLFDPAFFGVSPHDAELMDPQLRMLLMHSWKAFEDAGYSPATVNDCAVYMSASNNFYRNIEQKIAINPLSGTREYLSWMYAQPGSIATMISYHLDLCGPSASIHTNCSSSLAALYSACTTIDNSTSSYALIGGAALSPAMTGGYTYKEGMNFSSDGCLKAFDASADGMVPAEGAAVILIKNLRDAITDHDRIYAVIRGIDANNDGKDKAGFFAPSSSGQAKVIEKVLKKTGIDPETIHYIEAHGTGTKLGDPIEVEALVDTYRKYTSRIQYCGIGSVKTNIGHTDAAAGLAGCIKVALGLHHNIIPASIHFKNPNPLLNLETSPFYVADKAIVFDNKGTPARVALSSFGIGGTNVHAILEQAPQYHTVSEAKVTDNQEYLIPISAKSNNSLDAYLASLLNYLQRLELGVDDYNDSPAQLINIAYVLQLGREAMPRRIIFVVKNRGDLIAKITFYLHDRSQKNGVYTSESNTLANSFLKDEDLQVLVSGWIKDKDNQQLAKAWAMGVTINWSHLYEKKLDKINLKKVSLPTYQFNKEVCWLSDFSASKKDQVVDTSINHLITPFSAVKRSTVEQQLHTLSFVKENWIAEEIQLDDVYTLGHDSKIAEHEKKIVVCFVNDHANQGILTNHINSADNIRLIFIEDKRATYDSDSVDNEFNKYTLEDFDKPSVSTLFQKITNDVGHIDAVIYLWAVENQDYVSNYEPLFSSVCAFSTLAVAPKVFLIAGQWSNDDNIFSRCYMDSWIGFEQSTKFLFSNTSVVTIIREVEKVNSEHGYSVTENTIAIWRDIVWRELKKESFESVLYRNAQRHVLRRSLLPDPFENQQLHATLKLKGTYLITGGCGALGFLFAEYLAKNFSANLILVGRSVLNKDIEQKLELIRSCGAQAIYIEANLGDEQSVQKMLHTSKTAYGQISGIIHCAGMQDEKILFEKTFSEFNLILEPKVYGSQILFEVLKKEAIDFICFFSSSAAIIGDFGSCDYAIANRFQMALAVSIAEAFKNTTRIFSVNWPQWEIGGARSSDDEKTAAYLKFSGQQALDVTSGIKIFEQILSSNHNHLMPVVAKEEFLAKILQKKVSDNANSDVLLINSSSQIAPPHLGALDVELGLALEHELVDITAQLLKIPKERLGLHDNLMEIGFDSIKLADFSAQISKIFSLKISPSIFFGYSTISQISQHLCAKYPGEIAIHYANQQTGHKSTFSESPAVLDANNSIPTVQNNSKTDITIPEPIAIIGMSGRFPQARNIDEFWEFLANGQSAITEIPANRFSWQEFFVEGTPRPGKSISKWGGFIPGVREFDPLFFEISPVEAEAMDPRQRLLLQEAWNALEDAGYGEEQIKNNNIGTYVGFEQGDYQLLAANRGGVTANHDAVLAARLPYFLNLKGPTMTLNTACSSGLVAAHQACLSLREGDCDTAIVAGGNLLLTPMSYIGNSNAGILSSDGRSFTFDSRANGIVPAEAMVVLVLKKLRLAEAAGDPIHAVICGIGINYDGRTNGITSPDSISQVNLIKKTYKKYNIDANDISYIVAHGTGTKLGDPVEINALSEAFSSYTNKTKFCALTSSKTNFGHTFAASGLLSLVNVVKAMQNEIIPSSLNCIEVNEYIDWVDSPFYVNTTNRAWKNIGEKSRLGAVSAFGVSGTNAHAVLQSYDIHNEVIKNKLPGLLFVLSGKSDVALKQRAVALLDYIRSKKIQDHNLIPISYTLLTGRHHFHHRCALVADDVENLVFLLECFISAKSSAFIFQGTCKRHFTEDATTKQHIKQLLDSGRTFSGDKNAYFDILGKLSELFCQGYLFDGEAIFVDPSIKRIHLPTYPFSQKEYWVDTADAVSEYYDAVKNQSFKSKQQGMITDKSIVTRADVLHPLLQRNISDLDGHIFYSELDCNKFYVADHLINSEPVMPAAAYFEMLRVATIESLGAECCFEKNIVLQNITWLRPLNVKEKTFVKIFLKNKTNNILHFEVVFCHDEKSIYELCCQGDVYLAERDVAKNLDVQTTAKNMKRLSFSREDYYQSLQGSIYYGSGYRGLNDVYVGNNTVLAKLQLHESFVESFEYLDIHPGLLDSAFQASLGLQIAELQNIDLHALAKSIPFSVNRVEIYKKFSTTMWAFLKYNSSHRQNDVLERLDVELYDDSGCLCIRFDTLVSKIVSSAPMQTPLSSATHDQNYVPSQSPEEVHLRIPTWIQVNNIELDKPASEQHQIMGSNTVIFGEKSTLLDELTANYFGAQVFNINRHDSIDVMVDRLSKTQNIEQVIWIAPKPLLSSYLLEELISNQSSGIYHCFNLIKALFKLRYFSKNLTFTVLTHNAQQIHTGDFVDPTHAGIHGLFGSLAKEIWGWKIKVIDLSINENFSLQEILSIPAHVQGDAYAYRAGRWYQQALLPLKNEEKIEHNYRQNGTYVVIGGAGGIGYAWSELMLRQHNINIVWIGRTPINESIIEKQLALAEFGNKPLYLSADATDVDALQKACTEIKNKFGEIHGVIHSAVISEDQALLNMDQNNFAAVLKTKIDLTINIIRVFQYEPLDFLLIFSSLNSFSKAPGQSHYAAGCIFSDAFAQYVAKYWMIPIKVINWGYWGNIGMAAIPELNARHEKLGFGSLEPADGIKAINYILANPVSQLAYFKTIKPLTFSLGADPEGESINIILEKSERVANYSGDNFSKRSSTTANIIQFDAALKNQFKTLAHNIDAEIADIIISLINKSSNNDQKGIKVIECGSDNPMISARVPVALKPYQHAIASYDYIDADSLYLNNIFSHQYSFSQAHNEQSFSKRQELTLASGYDVHIIRKNEHNNHNFRHTLRRVKNSLRRKGILILVSNESLPQKNILENNSRISSAYAEISQNAFLNIAIQNTVESEGFKNINVIDFDVDSHKWQIIVGESDGIVRSNEVPSTLMQSLPESKVISFAKTLTNKSQINLPMPTVQHTNDELASTATNIIINTISTGLKLDRKEIEVDRNFADYGIDSIVAVNLINILSEHIGEALQTTLFFDYSNVEQLSSYLLDKHRLSLSQVVAREAVEEGVANAQLVVGDSALETIFSTDDSQDENLFLLKKIRTIVIDCVVFCLKVSREEIETDIAFSEYGVDSIIAVNLINVINERLSLTLNTTVLFDYNNLDTLAAFIVEQHKDDVIEQLTELAPTKIAYEKKSVAAISNLKTSDNLNAKNESFIAVLDEVSESSLKFINNADAKYASTPVIHVSIKKPSLIDELCLEQSTLPDALKDHYVRIAVRAFSLNFSDYLCLIGMYPNMPPYPFTPGGEASGVVIAVGNNVSGIKIGDSVIALPGEALGAHANVLDCHESRIIPKPVGLTHEEACSMPVVALTMIHAFQKARVKRGDKILIQTAAGGTGLIAIQLAQHHGAEIFATAGSQEKLDYLHSLGVNNLINYREKDFENEIQRMTQGRGVDVVINTLPGDAIQKGLNSLASGGRYIEIAMTALKSAKSIDLSALNNNQEYYSVDVGQLGACDPTLFSQYLNSMCELITSGVIRPTIAKVFAIEDVKDAFRTLQNRHNIGKVVVSISQAYSFTQTENENSTIDDSDVAISSTVESSKEKIAVIGLSGRFSKAGSAAEFWQSIANGEELISDITRWDLRKYYPDSGNNNWCLRGGHIDDIASFDPVFFNISGIEATYMDPQQRLFLEDCWIALEDGGYCGVNMTNRNCSVFVGCNAGDYQMLFSGDVPAQAFWGNSGSIVPARIAYLLDLDGPAISIDTACSSSLVAIHMACQSLLNNESTMALAGGVHIQSTPSFFLSASKAGMLSATGTCYTFDSRANGFVPGEGVGVVLLKRLSDAIHDKDNIYGVIAGSGLNQDGASNGITAPSGRAQEKLLKSVYEKCSINCENIQMVEAHGTGTKLGDPIEFNALANVYCSNGVLPNSCALGSVKTNIGHVASAAGVASVIKILMSLRHKQMPASLNYEAINPYINIANSPFYINTTTKNWEQPTDKNGRPIPRCAAISSFGFSGTNAHIVIQEAPDAEAKACTRPAYMIVLTALSPEQLKQYVQSLLDFCIREPDARCCDISSGLLLGRKHFTYRFATVVSNLEQLKKQLSNFIFNIDDNHNFSGAVHKNLFAEDHTVKKQANEEIKKLKKIQILQNYYDSLGGVSKLFVKGYSLDYAEIYFDENIHKISLPTYPFARDRYWIDEAKSVQKKAAPLTVASTQNKDVYESIIQRVLENKLDINSACQEVTRVMEIL